MGLFNRVQLYTEKQYLDYERSPEERHESQDGEIILLDGENIRHGSISVNLILI